MFVSKYDLGYPYISVHSLNANRFVKDPQSNLFFVLASV